MRDRKLFNKVVYTPMSEALRLLDERRKDLKLFTKIEELLKGDIPEIFKNKKCAVLFRQVATPNHESLMFIKIAKENDLQPIFFEFHEDKFISNNDFKHSLGQLQIPEKINKKGYQNVEKVTIVDFNEHSGKKFKDVKTLWGESLIDFHKNLFSTHITKEGEVIFFNASDWFKQHGGNSVGYYANFFLLFVCHGILFENFLTSDDSEGDFTRGVVLPGIEKVMELTNVKPLINPIGPLEIETDELWYHHLPQTKKHINKIQL